MAERKIIIRGNEELTSAPSVPITNEKPEPGPSTSTKNDISVRPRMTSVLDKKVEKKKDNLWTKTKRAFLGESESFGDLLERVWLEGFIPGMKVLIFDSFFGGVETFLFNESSGRRYGGRSIREAGYSNRYRRESLREKEDRLRGRSADLEAWEDIEPMSMSDCKKVLRELESWADKHEFATAEDLLYAMGFEENEIDYTEIDKVWYYEDLRHVEFRPVRGGYILDMPRYRKNPDYDRSRYRR